MQVISNDTMIKLVADEGMRITNSDRTLWVEKIFLPPSTDISGFEEVGRDVWKYFIKEENPDVQELQNITNDLQEDVEVLKEDTFALNETQLMAEETDNIIMTAIVDSDEKHETLADVLLCAVDELFTMAEPLLTVNEELCVMGEETKSRINALGGESMVELYVVMIQRGLKTIEQVPARYREQVKALLDALEE